MIFDKFYRGKDQRYLVRGRGWVCPLRRPSFTRTAATSPSPANSAAVRFFPSACPPRAWQRRPGEHAVNAANILVADDEPQIRRVLRATLTSQGYVLTDAQTGEEAVEIARKTKPRPDDLLDINMPGMGGIETCREIRRFSSAPIIMLTVRNAESDKVLALDAGADDYVVKPFGIEELLARIRASLRRYSTGETLPPFSSKDISMDFEKPPCRSARPGGTSDAQRIRSLRDLVTNQGKPLTHRRLLQAVWGPDYGEETETLRVVINQLRKKIEANPTHPKFILTEPWVGYRFQPPKTPARKS